MSEQQRPRAQWNAGTILAAGLWLALTGGAAFVLFFFVAITASAGADTALGRFATRSAALPTVGVGGLAALGPLGIWVFRRTRLWLSMGVALVGLGLLAGLFLFVISA